MVCGYGNGGRGYYSTVTTRLSKYWYRYFYLWNLKNTYFNEGKTENPLFDEFWFRWNDEEK
jgi:hypothetical protein